MPLTTLTYHIANAFAPKPHTGNQASVVLFPNGDDPRAKDDDWHRDTAKDFGYAETAFLIPLDMSDAAAPRYGLRWFTPAIEVPLCGHATLAAATVLFGEVHPQAQRVVFDTRFRGELIATREGARGGSILIGLDFPLTEMTPADEDDSQRLGALVASAADLSPSQVIGVATGNFAAGAVIIEIGDDVDLEKLSVDPKPLNTKETSLTIITQLVTSSASGSTVRINSRVFAPDCGIDEDPVVRPSLRGRGGPLTPQTGAAHTCLVSYFLQGSAAPRVSSLLPDVDDMSRVTLDARQLSARGGGMLCSLVNGRAKLIGRGWRWASGELVVLEA